MIYILLGDKRYQVVRHDESLPTLCEGCAGFASVSPNGTVVTKDGVGIHPALAQSMYRPSEGDT